VAEAVRSSKDCDKRINRVRDVSRRMLHDRKVEARFDGSVRNIYPTSVTPAEGNALRKWVMRGNAATTVETGLGYGLSTLFICEGLLANGHSRILHVALDPFQEKNANIGLQVIEDAGLQAVVEFHSEESQLALPRFLAEGRLFDLAFVDGNHRFDGVFLDLIYVGRLLRRGGIVVVDDLQLPSIARATSFCTRNLGWTLEEESREDESHHWAVFRTARAVDGRPFDHYVDF
jgi:predicted O-methyltransferase YrrM